MSEKKQTTYAEEPMPWDSLWDYPLNRASIKVSEYVRKEEPTAIKDQRV